MLQFKNVLFKHGDRTLLEDVSFVVHAEHRVGIVGRNGVGKTTLFDLVLGRQTPADGDIFFPKDWRISWLDQYKVPSDQPALDFVIDGDREVRRIERMIKSYEDAGDYEHAVNLYAEYEDAGGYRTESVAGTILFGLGFTKEDFVKPHREFSGGWRIRLNLAQTLMTPADLLLLDEPTNHLDLEATLWLEKWLSYFKGTLLTIAHDRDFLNRTVDEIIHIEHQTTCSYVGNYESFERQRIENFIRQEVLFQRQEQERQRIQKFINRFRANSKKAPLVQSRIKALERMKATAPLRPQSSYDFQFVSPSRMDQPMVKIDDVTVGYGGNIVAQNITEKIYPRDRIGILGLNGAGKTTLLKVLAGDMEPLSGEIEFGVHASVAYFAQHQLEVLDGAKSPMETFLDQEVTSEQAVREYLGRWGVQSDDVHRPVSQFSGGEKARLVLALIARQKPSLLLLDEPTNHLDLDMRNSLATALQQYEGAVLMVAHDRSLLRQCMNQYWLVKDGTVRRFDDDIDRYAASIDIQIIEIGRTRKPRKSDLRKHRAEVRNRNRGLVKKRAQLEHEISRIQLRVNELTNLLGDQSTFDSNTASNIQKWIREHGLARNHLDELERQWLDVSEQLELDNLSEPAP